VPFLDGKRLEQESTILFPLTALTDEPGCAGVVHRLRDLAAHVMGSRGGNDGGVIHIHVDGKRLGTHGRSNDGQTQDR
jgi:hypothetical protein